MIMLNSVNIHKGQCVKNASAFRKAKDVNTSDEVTDLVLAYQKTHP